MNMTPALLREYVQVMRETGVSELHLRGCMIVLGTPASAKKEKTTGPKSDYEKFLYGATEGFESES